MKPNHDENIEEAPFNMASLFYVELHIIRKLKSKAFIEGELDTYKDCLEEIATCVSVQAKSEEVQEIISMLKNAENTPLTSEQNIKLYRNRLRQIDIKLMQLMKKYRMIFPNIDSNAGLNNLYKKYNLE